MRKAEAVEACMSSCTLSGHPTLLTIAEGRSDPSGAVRTCAGKMQLKARPNIKPQGCGFESQLCHTDQTSGKNGVGQHW